MLNIQKDKNSTFLLPPISSGTTRASQHQKGKVIILAFNEAWENVPAVASPGPYAN